MATDLAYGHGSDNWLAWWLCSFLYKTFAQQTQPVLFVLARNSTGNVSPVGQALLKSPQTYSQWQKKYRGIQLKVKKQLYLQPPPPPPTPVPTKTPIQWLPCKTMSEYCVGKEELVQPLIGGQDHGGKMISEYLWLRLGISQGQTKSSGCYPSECIHPLCLVWYPEMDP